ncbi:MAG: putative adhesin [Roseobacter sp.]|uniref:putative adhesin n=1 Tax=Alphaproteobacteria TaxID=28211 RepID=UPI003266F967
MWSGRAVTWFCDKYSAHQAHKARLGFVRLVLNQRPDVFGNFSTKFGSSNQGADRQKEVERVLGRLMVIVNKHRNQLKNLSALTDEAGFRKILINEEHLRGNSQGILIKLNEDKHTVRHGRLYPNGYQFDGVHSNLEKTYECERQTTNKLNLFIPTKVPAQGEPIKVLIEAHGITKDNQFTVKENGLKLKFLCESGEKLRFAPLTPSTELDVVEVQELTSGVKTLDYTLSAFSGVESACQVVHNGKKYTDESVPKDLRRKVKPIIHQTDDKLLEYAKNTNTIVVSPKLTDRNDERVIIKLSEIYTLLHKRYPNNPLEISCKFCRGISA